MLLPLRVGPQRATPFLAIPIASCAPGMGRYRSPTTQAAMGNVTPPRGQPCRPLTRVPGFIHMQHPRREPKAGLNPGHQPCCQSASPRHLALRAPALLAPRGSSQFPTSSLGPAFTPWPRSLWWCRAFILVSKSLLGGSWWPV